MGDDGEEMASEEVSEDRGGWSSPQRLKPRSYESALRGAAAPLFHGTTRVLLALRGVKGARLGCALRF